MTRFNSIDHLEAFKAGRGYPKIHDNLFNLIAETWDGGSFLDICCSTGLLGQRIIDKLGCPCAGVEGDAEAIELAKRYGVQMTIHESIIGVRSLAVFAQILIDHEVNTIVMRRCVSELFATGLTLGVGNTVQEGVNAAFAAIFVNMITNAGVNEVYLQGRAETTQAKHPIPNIYAEMQFFLPHYEIQVERGQCAYLRRVQPNENTEQKVA